MKNFRQVYYDAFSRCYDRFIALHSRLPQGIVKQYLAARVPLENGGKVLDLCCGTAAFLIALGERTGREGLAVGLDFSAGMLAAAREKTKERAGIGLVRANAGALPFASHCFDAVTCTHAFYELKGTVRDGALREIVRVLKPGGTFFMVEHDLPENVVTRMLFYVRLASMGLSSAVSILRREADMLRGYFKTVEKSSAPTGRTKIYLCRT